MCSPHVATNAMQPMMAIATQSFNLLFFFTSANCTILPSLRQITDPSGFYATERQAQSRSLRRAILMWYNTEP